MPESLTPAELRRWCTRTFPGLSWHVTEPDRDGVMVAAGEHNCVCVQLVLRNNGARAVLVVDLGRGGPVTRRAETLATPDEVEAWVRSEVSALITNLQQAIGPYPVPKRVGGEGREVDVPPEWTTLNREHWFRVDTRTSIVAEVSRQAGENGDPDMWLWTISLPSGDISNISDEGDFPVEKLREAFAAADATLAVRVAVAGGAL
jgi:hypothetical protein